MQGNLASSPDKQEGGRITSCVPIPHASTLKDPGVSPWQRALGLTIAPSRSSPYHHFPSTLFTPDPKDGLKWSRFGALFFLL